VDEGVSPIALQEETQQRNISAEGKKKKKKARMKKQKA
jgi:hypothetical protein